MIALVTGSQGLVGSESVKFLINKGLDVIGIDNDRRKYFFGKEASTENVKKELLKFQHRYKHKSVDIRSYSGLEKIFKEYGKNIVLIIHAAAQPSHDWAIKEPHTDFNINAVGTLNLLELTKIYSNQAVFIQVSTNKVYGDTPNRLPLKEKETRYEIDTSHEYYYGIDETMSIDNSTHSLFGVSKCAGDLLAQEYGRNIGLKTGIFRAGCITGPNHAGAELHGFLNYLVKANIEKIPYTIYGYKGKQVRDNIHSYDLVNCFWHFYELPKNGEVYNIGGGRDNSCSILEAIKIIEDYTKVQMNYTVKEQNRIGDHQWYISNVGKLYTHFDWEIKYTLKETIREIVGRYK
jgi:CDP-paratose 2-epimerase